MKLFHYHFVLKIDTKVGHIFFCHISIPVDTGHKLRIRKTFRRRPGRLLNILCTFSLRLESAGILVLRIPLDYLGLFSFVLYVEIHAFFVSNTLYKDHQAEIGKKSSKS